MTEARTFRKGQIWRYKSHSKMVRIDSIGKDFVFVTNIQSGIDYSVHIHDFLEDYTLTEHQALLTRLFNIVFTHLLAQGKRAEEDGDCQYHAPQGLMCAAGCLILPQHYSEDMEQENADSLRVLKGIQASQNMSEDEGHIAAPLLLKLQKIHDQIAPEHWEDKLEELRDEWGIAS